MIEKAFAKKPSFSTNDLLKLLDDSKENTPVADETTDDSIKIYGKQLPAPIELSSVWDKPSQLAPEIIEGVLRQKHKMILTAPSKAGKTFAMLELAIAVATGGKWLGFQCKQGKTLYVNFELDGETCFSRFKAVGTALKIKPENLKKILVWNLRGKNVPFEQLADEIVKLAKKCKFDLVILDPIYKPFAEFGSENDQEAVSKFCNIVDIIAAETSVVYVHHHSKGVQGNKDPMDRGSGSGVFARDADAILDMEQAFLNGNASVDPDDPNVTAWTLEGVLREFAPFQPKKIYFRYPLHEVCEDGALDKAKPKTKNQIGGKVRGDQKENESIANYKRFEKAFEELSKEGKPVKIKNIAESIGMTDKTVRKYATKGGYIVSNGTIAKDGN